MDQWDRQNHWNRRGNETTGIFALGTYDAAGATVTVTGDTAQIRLAMAGSGGSYGYKLDSVTAGAVRHKHPFTQTLPPTCTRGHIVTFLYRDLVK